MPGVFLEKKKYNSEFSRSLEWPEDVYRIWLLKLLLCYGLVWNNHKQPHNRAIVC